MQRPLTGWQAEASCAPLAPSGPAAAGSSHVQTYDMSLLLQSAGCTSSAATPAGRPSSAFRPQPAAEARFTPFGGGRHCAYNDELPSQVAAAPAEWAFPHMGEHSPPDVAGAQKPASPASSRTPQGGFGSPAGSTGSARSLQAAAACTGGASLSLAVSQAYGGGCSAEDVTAADARVPLPPMAFWLGGNEVCI